MDELRVLNLNCWGIRYVSSAVQERIEALVKVLNSAAAHWDFVVLEEIWADQDYQHIAESAKNAYPFSYYFYSGVLGSGVCVFSRGQITQVLTHTYSLNGYFHKLQHGDWFGGKVAGLCRIYYKNLKINLYATHVHAEYNRKSDEYLPHRIVQAYELSQFIKCTSSEQDDVNIVAGDFNFEPDDLGYAIVRRFADLKDAWVCRENASDDDDGLTCNTPDNIYSRPETSEDKVPRGKRIDYILFGNIGNRPSVSCVSSNTVLNRIPDSSLCYSDHKGLEAVLRISREGDIEPPSPAISVPSYTNTLDEALEVLGTGIKRTRETRYFWLAVLVVALAVLAFTADIDKASATLVRWMMNLARVGLTMLVAWCFTTVVVLCRTEHHALLAAKNAMLIQKKWEEGPQGREMTRRMYLHDGTNDSLSHDQIARSSWPQKTF
ncbi:hypothetical protein RvY_13655 [Ramazzottius varieornatus]|uniref:sphingomyelin phosphodiesterase n=1 Tax=Ramazzottius varieornatus TaxID=947166 RepID=A0A1D1VNP2_RAMVA|nr:hypothetical protein RvY_13655 [Ramazzottius varieornatus]